MPSITVQVADSTSDARSASGGGLYTATATSMFLGKYTDGNDYHNGFRFGGVAVPQGATITSATLDLYSSQQTGGTTVSTIWHCEAADNPVQFSSTRKPADLTTTTASDTYSITVANFTALGFGVDAIPVTNSVQEIISRAGWVSGNALVLIGHDNGSAASTYVGSSTYDRAATRGAKLTITYSISAIPTAPTSLAATEVSGSASLTWTDNSSNEDGFYLYRKRGSSSNYYLVTTLAANATSYTDTDVDPGYTYTYQLSAYNTDGESTKATSSTITMSGTKSWTGRVQAWIYPGPPADDADEEYRDGRVIHTLKTEYFVLNSSGVLTQLNAPGDGENAYSGANAADVINYSDEQYITVASTHANMAVLVADSTKRSNAVTTLVNMCTTTGYTGVELDFEGFADWTTTDYTNYKSFVQQLGTALHAAGNKLIVDGPPITNLTEQGYYEWKYEDFDSITEVDQVAVMLYDYQYDYGGGSSVQPASWARNGAAWVRSKINNPDRIILGIPSYGYHATTGGYTITIDTKDQSTAFTGYGTATRNADDEMTWVNSGISYVYQDSTGLDSKRERLEDEGIKHVSVWHLGGNDWFAAHSEIPRSTSATTGQMKVHDGTSFVPKPVKVWNGTSWEVKPTKHWDGSAWTATVY